MLLLSNNIHDYYFVSQGKTTIPGLDDGEELLITDVSASFWPVKHSFSSLSSDIRDRGRVRFFFLENENSEKEKIIFQIANNFRLE